MKMRKGFNKALITVMTLVFMVGCSNAKDSFNDVTSTRNTKVIKEDMDFEDLNTKEVNDSIEKYSKQLGISKVEKVDVDWQLAVEQYTDKKDSSQYLFVQKKINIDSPYILAKLLEYIADAKLASQDEVMGLTNSDSKAYILEPKEKVDKVNREIKAIKDGKLKEHEFKYVEFAGYPYYPDAKKGEFDQFRPNIKLVGKDGKSLDINFRLDSLNMLINKSGTPEIKKVSDVGMEYFEGMLYSKSLSEQIGKDSYKILKDHKLDFDYLMSTKTVRMPEKLKEATYGDRFNLYWAGVDTMIKSNGFNEGIDKHLSKDISVDIYHIRPIDVLESGQEKSDSAKAGSDINPSGDGKGPDQEYPDTNEQKIYDHVNKLVILRDKEKNIGAYLSSDKNIYNLDHKNISQATGKTYDQWLDSAFEDDEDRRELAKLDSHQFIKKYVDMLTVKDFDAQAFYIPELSIYNGKISDRKSTFVNEFKNNVVSATLIQAENRPYDGELGPYKSDPRDIVLDVVIDFKFKDEVTRMNGENQSMYTLRKLSDSLGYRIISQGI